jgi:hypothetical protein
VSAVPSRQAPAAARRARADIPSIDRIIPPEASSVLMSGSWQIQAASRGQRA